MHSFSLIVGDLLLLHLLHSPMLDVDQCFSNFQIKSFKRLVKTQISGPCPHSYKFSRFEVGLRLFLRNFQVMLRDSILRTTHLER